MQKRFRIKLEQGSEHTTRSEVMKRNQEIFYRCYRSLEGTSTLPETFNAQYGLFRILLTTFILLGVAALIRLTEAFASARRFDLTAASLFAFSFVAGLISYWRVTKRAEDFARSVYDLFLAQSAKDAAPVQSSLRSVPKDKV